MDKVIPFNKGIRRQPSLGEAGELSECVNLIPQNGELVNVRGMEDIGIKLDDGDKYIGSIKTNAEYDVHIATSGSIIKYVLSDKKSAEPISFIGDTKKIETDSTITRCVIFGNCLAYYNPNASYLLLRDGKFVNFDEIISDIQVSFGLESKQEESEVYTREYARTGEDYAYQSTYISEGWEDATNFVGEIEKSGRFVNPFFVRYAYRMFDNSIKFHSTPVLMPCCNKYGAVGFEKEEIQPNLAKVKVVFRCYSHDLYYTCLKGVGKGIDSYVKDVEIYVCPIKFVREGVGELIDDNYVDGYFSYSTSEINRKGFEKRKISKDVSALGGYSNVAIFWDEALSYGELEQCAPFFKLASIPFSSFNMQNNYVKIPSKDLTTLTDTLEENRNEYFRFEASTLFSYNNRVMRANLKRTLVSEYPLMKHVGCSYVVPSNTEGASELEDTYSIWIETAKDDKKIYTSLGDYKIAKDAYIPYLFFPYENVSRMFLCKNNNPTNWHAVEFKNSLFQYGSYAFKNMAELLGPTIQKDSFNGVPIADILPNTIQLSNANTPFVYDPVNEVVVGNGEIIGISTASKALSQGQFGQYPLYVFCTDGIWALDIADDGTFSAKHPISRDVCNNPDSITQIDGAVVFTTDQGLKLIQGSEVVLLSGHLEGHNVDEDVYFKKSEDGTGFFAKYNLGEFDKLINPESRDIRDIFRTCKLAYDYANQLLRIYPKRIEDEEGYIDDSLPYKYYVYSFTTSEFATVIGDEFAVEKDGEITYDEVTKVVPDYPSSIVQIGSKLYRPMETEREELQDGLILTRPLTLDEPFALKKLQDMRLNYSNFKGDSNRNSKCRVVLYVSNDGHKWTMINSFRGGAYKYFRIAVATKLTDADALTGAVMRYSLERTNKLR